MFGRGAKKKVNGNDQKMDDNTQIVDLEQGCRLIDEDGIRPAIQLFEEGDEKGEFKAHSYVKVYDMIFRMCIQREPYNFSDKLYEKYTSAIQDYCVQYGARLLQRSINEGKRSDEFLNTWSKRWENLALMIMAQKRLFTYLDRFHTASQDAILPLNEQGYHVYRERVFDKFAPRARAAILELIDNERNAVDVNRDLLKRAVKAFEEMGVFQGTKLKIYREQLETAIVDSAANFYRQKCRNWITQDSAPHYLRKAEKHIEQEKSRVAAYLNRITMQPLVAACYKEILKEQQAALLDKKTGLSKMLDDNATEDLTRLFNLYYKDEKDASDLQPIADRFHDHVAREGTRIVREAQERGVTSGDANSGLVSRLIALHDQYERIVTECFAVKIDGERGGMPMFKKALKKAFESFINKDDKVSNLLAEYVNEVLKKNSKINIKNVSLEAQLSNIAHLYFYIHDKDVFERSYQMFLQHRLLNGEFENEHSEKSMIQKLKHGNYSYTNKLEGMFKDVQSSNEMTKRFIETPEGKQLVSGPNNVALEVHVCTTAYWPRPDGAARARCPAELKSLTESYDRFYKTEHKGHRLEWRFEQGTAEVVCHFNTATRKILRCSTYQMMLLLQFNTATKPMFQISYETIKDTIGLNNFEIGHHLLSMCHPDVKVIKKSPNNARLEDDHLFCINPNYSNKMHRVPIPTMNPPAVQQRAQDLEEKAKHLRRRNQMDAAIVRIMKARKQLKHNVLVGEATAQLQKSFKPAPADLKRRIEALIDQEYLERLPNDRGTYKYLA